MKRQFLLLVAIAVFVTAFTTNASGQTGKTARANIKFDFQIGDRVYPAGEYWIESISWHANVLRIRHVSDTNKTTLILANRSNAGTGKRQTPRLVFHKYAEDYFLTGIFLDTEQWGYSILPSRRHRGREKDVALAPPEIIEVSVFSKKSR